MTGPNPIVRQCPPMPRGTLSHGTGGFDHPILRMIPDVFITNHLIGRGLDAQGVKP